MKTIIITALLIAASGCASSSTNEEFKAGFAECAMMCKANPEIKEYSQNHGGGFTLLFFGGEEKKCTCNR